MRHGNATISDLPKTSSQPDGTARDIQQPIEPTWRASWELPGTTVGDCLMAFIEIAFFLRILPHSALYTPPFYLTTACSRSWSFVVGVIRLNYVLLEVLHKFQIAQKRPFWQSVFVMKIEKRG